VNGLTIDLIHRFIKHCPEPTFQPQGIAIANTMDLMNEVAKTNELLVPSAITAAGKPSRNREVDSPHGMGYNRVPDVVAVNDLLVHSDDGLNNFGAIRLAMALLVVWSHSFALGLPTGEATEPIYIVTNRHLNAGNVGVLVFFTISGFLICESYLKTGDFLRFIIKRIKRIYPGYMAATTLGAFVVIPLFSSVYMSSWTESSKTFGLNLLLRNYAPPSIVFARNYSQALNGSLWSIPYEFWCYVGIAALGLLRLLTKTWLIVILIFASIFLRATLDLLDKKPGLGLVGEVFGWPYLWLLVLPCFLMGTACFLLRNRLLRSKFILAGLIICFFIACYLPIGATWQKILTEAIFPFAMAYVVFYFSFSKTIRVRHATSKGDFSYGTYLFAFPIQQMLVSGFLLPFSAFVVLSLALSLGAGFVSWHLVEKRFLLSRFSGRTELHPV
jgi:peptidoglycan/LPS O-acetylase OafA/YrhL